ncbi:MAG: DNA-binding response regulator [Bacteroidetes bacterium]|nr:MAG: DNA-binding response regulator [Bacteroidota bacterium]
MAKVKIVVVEDEIVIADNICEILTDLGYDVAEPAISYSEALQTINEHKPDLAIIDINLRGKKDGIDIAQTLKSDYCFPYIFLTSNTDKRTVDRAKKVTPSAYLVKPFSKDELYTAIEIAISNFEKKTAESDLNDITTLNQSLFIKQKKLFIKIKFEDILYIKSDHVYVEILSNDNHKFLVRGSLNEYISKLDSNFVRIHRGYIINLMHITVIDQDYVEIGNQKVPIGKNYREELLQRINVG